LLGEDQMDDSSATADITDPMIGAPTRAGPAAGQAGG
jgi:hypothetical protein